MNNNPCRFCERRTFKCHATCPEYSQYRAEIEQRRSAERRRTDCDSDYYATKERVKRIAQGS